MFSRFWIIQKIFLEKKFFSTQNRSIRVKNMFLRFSIFFPKKLPPDLVIFRPKNEILDFDHLFEFGVLIWLDITYYDSNNVSEGL